MNGLKIRLLEVPAARWLLHLTVRPLEPQEWVFVLGCYNSGTTLLARLLGCHGAIGGLPKEGAALSPDLPRPEDLGWTRMWVECRDYLSMPSHQGDRLARNIRRDWSLFAKGGDRLMLEKSISNLPRAVWLAEHFAPARFIGIIRDPYAVCEGIRRKARPRHPAVAHFPDGYDVAQTARQWLAANRELERLAREDLDVHMIRYESLVSDPVETLAAAFAHLDLECPAMSWSQGTLDLAGIRFTLTNMNAGSGARLSEQDFASINATLGDAVETFGYKIANKVNYGAWP